MSQTVSCPVHDTLTVTHGIWEVFDDGDPIANGASWTAAADFASQVQWQDTVCSNLSATDIISAGVYFGTSPMSIQGLIEQEGDANKYVKDYCSHNYPQSSPNYNLSALMSHSGIASQIAPFAAEVSTAAAVGKPHIFGETNSGNANCQFYYCYSNKFQLPKAAEVSVGHSERHCGL